MQRRRGKPAPLEPIPFRDEGHGYDVFGLSPRVLRRAITLGRPIYERYFRARSYGAQHIPSHGPVILAANHSGVLPVDAMMLCLDVLLQTHPRRVPRAVIDRFVPLIPFVSTVYARMGAVTGTTANVRQLLERGELLVIWPEGTTGISKPFRERYELQAWRVGHAELGLRYRAPIVPVAVIGAEESWPIVGRLPVHVFGSPYLPIPAVPLPLPIRYDIHYGEPIALHEPYSTDAADDPEVVAEAAGRVRAAVQELIRRGLARRDGRLT